MRDDHFACTAYKLTVMIEHLHMHLFIAGIFPDCKTCDACFDHWAKRVDAIGIELEPFLNETRDLQNDYGKFRSKVA